MLTVESFVSTYENYSDEEIFHAYKNINDYSTEAQEALSIAMDQKGGLENITNRLKQKHALKSEEQRIANEVTKLCAADVTVDFLKTIIKSDVYSQDETERIIEEKYSLAIHAKEDVRVKPRTIIGSVLGGGLGSIIGGILWGLQMIQMHRIFYIFIVGLAILSYGFIRFFTKQSKANVAVITATVLSVIGALLIGQLLFNTYG